MAHSLLTQGLNVVCDSPLPALSYQNARRIAAETGAGLVIIECVCSDVSLWQAHFEARKADTLPARRLTDWPVFQRLLTSAEPRPTFTVDADVPHLIVDAATGSPDEALARVLAWLNVREQSLSAIPNPPGPLY